MGLGSLFKASGKRMQDTLANVSTSLSDWIDEMFRRREAPSYEIDGTRSGTGEIFLDMKRENAVHGINHPSRAKQGEATQASEEKISRKTNQFRAPYSQRTTNANDEIVTLPKAASHPALTAIHFTSPLPRYPLAAASSVASLPTIPTRRDQPPPLPEWTFASAIAASQQLQIQLHTTLGPLAEPIPDHPDARIPNPFLPHPNPLMSNPVAVGAQGSSVATREEKKKRERG